MEEKEKAKDKTRNQKSYTQQNAMLTPSQKHKVKYVAAEHNEANSKGSFGFSFMQKMMNSWAFLAQWTKKNNLPNISNELPTSEILLKL